MLGSLALAAALQVDTHTKAWLDALTKVARVERTSLCVDIDETAVPRTFHYPKPDGYRGLDRLAVAIGRSRSVVEGVHIFRRKSDEDGARPVSPRRTAMDMLTSLSVIDLSKLIRGELDFSSLSAINQRRLRLAVAMAGDGIGDSMLAEYPEQLGMRLVLDPVAYCTSRTGEGQVKISLATEQPKIPLPETVSPAVTPLGAPSDGTVSFGDGEILSLSQVCERAERALGRRVLYDSRLAASRLFISGTYTEPRLLAVLSAVLEPLPVKLQPTASLKEDFEAEKLSVVTYAFGPYSDEKIGIGGLTMNDVILGRQTTFKDLFGVRPPQKVQVFMAQYRLQPDDRVSLVGELYLAVAAPGLATLYTEQPDPTGRRIPYNLPHLVRFTY